jgi:hypothetical protein
VRASPGELKAIRSSLMKLKGLSWGTPGLKVKGRFLARLKEDGESLVLRIGFRQRERLMRTTPEVFYLTDHYLNYPAVLVRLPKIAREVLAGVVEDAWREVAPEELVGVHDAARRVRPRRQTRVRRSALPSNNRTHGPVAGRPNKEWPDAGEA